MPISPLILVLKEETARTDYEQLDIEQLDWLHEFPRQVSINKRAQKPPTEEGDKYSKSNFSCCLMIFYGISHSYKIQERR